MVTVQIPGTSPPVLAQWARDWETGIFHKILLVPMGHIWNYFVLEMWRQDSGAAGNPDFKNNSSAMYDLG